MAAVDKPSALLGENLNLNEVLGDYSKQSGGAAVIVATAGLVAGAAAARRDAAHGMRSSTCGRRAPRPTSASVKRPGISVRAPVRIREKAINR